MKEMNIVRRMVSEDFVVCLIKGHRLHSRRDTLPASWRMQITPVKWNVDQG